MLELADWRTMEPVAIVASASLYLSIAVDRPIEVASGDAMRRDERGGRAVDKGKKRAQLRRWAVMMMKVHRIRGGRNFSVFYRLNREGWRGQDAAAETLTNPDAIAKPRMRKRREGTAERTL